MTNRNILAFFFVFSASTMANSAPCLDEFHYGVSSAMAYFNEWDSRCDTYLIGQENCHGENMLRLNHTIDRLLIELDDCLGN
jgi:hypothetical protein